MILRLLALFVLLPLVELALVIQVGRSIGLLWTLALVVLTGVVGMTLARTHGLRAWIAIRDELQQGRVPTAALADGLLILIGGIVLLTPGFLTDLFGLALLFPATRTVFKNVLRRRFQQAVQRGDSRITFLLIR
jgi:UPF0716 protein FxsA